MWHKSNTTTLGTTLSPIGGQQLLTGLEIYYYDLADSNGFIVGKMFPDLKIFVIEDQELLFAMSYKSNRSWTLPNYTAITADIPDIPAGIGVTWNQPIIESGLGVTISCTQYCHSTSSGWINFTGQKSLVGVDQTGYRFWTCQPAYMGTQTCICAILIGGSALCGTQKQCDAQGVGVNYNTTFGPVSNVCSYYFKSCVVEY